MPLAFLDAGRVLIVFRIALLVLILVPMSPATADELMHLQKRIEQLEARQATPHSDCCGNRASSCKTSYECGQGRWLTNVKVGGFAKLDIIQDFDAIGSTDVFNPSTIPLDGTESRNFRAHARWTRLNLDVRQRTVLGDASVFVEADFFGEHHGVRLRDAYGSIGPWLAGRSFSTFIDETIIPDQVDIEAPRALLIARRAQLRWTQSLLDIDGLEYSVAIEDPAPGFAPSQGEFDASLPDFITRVRYDSRLCHLQAAGFGSHADYTSIAGLKSDDVAWGVNLTGRLQVLDADAISWEFAWGEGLQRFRGVQSYLIIDGRLRAIPNHGWFIGYEHEWSSVLKSVFTYAEAQVGDIPQFLDLGSFTSYLATNLLWQPDDSFRIGIEYLYGTRKDMSGRRGEAHRIQIGVWYYLP